MALTPAEIEQFVTQGFVRIDGAFPNSVAGEARAALWRSSGCDPDDRSTWTKPVIRLPGFGGGPFAAAVSTPTLHAACDQLCGVGRWMPRDGPGTFVIRFPVPGDPGDTGWHIDTSFPPPGGSTRTDYGDWRANVSTRDRLLLALFLFSDVGPDDAPTRIAVGSHQAMARVLSRAGEEGYSLYGMGGRGVFDRVADGREIACATGEAGTVWLCHPFLVHAAQENRGNTARFIAQPPIQPREQAQLERADGDYSPVERAIRQGLGR